MTGLRVVSVEAAPFPSALMELPLYTCHVRAGFPSPADDHLDETLDLNRRYIRNVIIDPAGDTHSLARRIEGVKAAQIRERLGGIDRQSLPSAAEGREMQRGQAEAQKERVADMQYEHFVAPIHQAVKEAGEVPVYGMEPTWWERAAGVISRMAEKAVTLAARTLEAAKGYWQDLTTRNTPEGQEHER